MSVNRLFKIVGKSYVVESIFSKVTEENSAFYKCFENSIRCSSINISISISIEGALLEISRSSLLTNVTGSHPTSCKATKIELLTKFL